MAETYFAVFRERGSAWDASRPIRQQPRWDGHAAFMDALVDSGVIVLGGPLGEGDFRSLPIFKADLPCRRSVDTDAPAPCRPD